jgi:hypothetical protein
VDADLDLLGFKGPVDRLRTGKSVTSHAPPSLSPSRLHGFACDPQCNRHPPRNRVNPKRPEGPGPVPVPQASCRFGKSEHSIAPPPAPASPACCKVQGTTDANQAPPLNRILQACWWQEPATERCL